MEGNHENHLRLLMLCKRTGDLWTADEITELNINIPEVQNQTDEYLLYGQLFSKLNVNFPAFWAIMQRAWKVDETGPWSFTGNLLVLQEGDPTILEHCYEFTHCSFWVHLVGLPRAVLSEECIQLIAGKMGEIEEVRIEARNNSSCKIGKVRVKLNLPCPLKTGTIIHVGDRNWWIDFKYERLPHFCYSCGYIESGIPQDRPGRYGSWLKAEVKNLSPCWNTFYGEIDFTLEADDMVPETPIIRSGDDSNNNSSTDEISAPEALIAQKKGKRIQQSPEQQGESKFHDAGMGIQVIAQTGPKKQTPKKLKRFLPYEKKASLTSLVDMNNLLDTPIQMWEGSTTGALVASPNKPPRKP
ncbi:hypothetical protein EUGRSUZ_H01492 [Eucalyptus grandis]|uniref:Zinc knuckle CX2CX4HX4C domain-containing protein n=2 Tax=Eucalyptus grandis TaxID=71139 RepID=A0A059AYY9_EUCGR|nr:hypothetical protein EUGRSUZ_H01492 [Eucalyptus grandis]